MHDPMTVAFEIKAPWFHRDKHFSSGRYHSALVTIWHVDPETDGSDDSCDWFGRKVPKEAREFAAEMAAWEEKFPYYFAQPVGYVRSYKADEMGGPFTMRMIGPGDCLALVLSVFSTAAWRLYRRDLSARDIRQAIRIGVHEGDNFQSALLDDPRQSPERTREDREAVLRRIIGCYLRERRPWWKHPRWHLHHWKIQVRGVQNFKRWAFSRCVHCGGRFAWATGVVGYSWDSDGPGWFRNAERIAHPECDRNQPRTRPETPAESAA